MSRRSILLTTSLCLLTTSAFACSLIQTSTPMPPTPEPSTPTPAPPAATSEPATPTAAVPTPTVKPPTPTPQPPTPTIAQEPRRIRFAPGATSAVVTGHVEEDGRQRYVLRALAGQTMEVRLTSPGNDVLLEIRGADGTVLKQHSDGETSWRGKLPSTQDYLIAAVSVGQETSYNLRTTVYARIEFEPGETAATVTGHVDRAQADGVEFGGGYVLRALAGQTMEVKITSPNEDMLLSIVGEDGVPLKRYVDGKNDWRGELPATQDYYIRPVSVGQETEFTLSVMIAPLGWQIHRDEEYGFEVWYPGEFVPDPSCYPVGVRGELALDLRLRGSEYYSGTNLLDACVIIGVSQHEGVISTCLEPVDALEESLGEEEVNGIALHKFSRTGVAAGNIFEEVSYRAVHSDACHEIALLMHSGNIGAYPEGTVTEFDRDRIMAKLEQALYTFRFFE